MDPELVESSDRAREEGASFSRRRFIYPLIKRLVGERIFPALVGPRGAGKTVILKQLLSETPASFYVSLDAQPLEGRLFNLAKELADAGTRFLFLDEVHAVPGYAGELKNIYDSFPSLTVAFTSSSALSLHESSYDLSRRVRIEKVHPFSFREFVFFEKNALLPSLDFAGLLDVETARAAYGKVLHSEPLFRKYVTGGNYPFALGKSNVLSVFRSVLDAVIERDIVLAGRASPEEAAELRAALSFSGKSPAEDVSPSSIARNLGITKYKAEKYVSLLEAAFVIRRVYPRGTNVTKEPKILFSLPYRLLYKDYESSIGALREDFFAEAMAYGRQPIAYLKTMRGEKTPDYVVNNTVLEVGGASKGAKQFKGFASKKRIILTQPGAIDELRRPLLLAGLLEHAEMYPPVE